MSEEIKVEELVEYEGRRIYPEVAEYLKSRKEADRAAQRAIRIIDHEYNTAYYELRYEAEDAGESLSRYGTGALAQKYQALDADKDSKLRAVRQARAEHGRELLQSPHKEVRFIAKECLFADQGDEIEGHARTILKHLPTTTEEIWRVAKDDAEMCGVFDRFYQQAEEQGVFQKEGEDPFPGLRELQAFRSYVRRDYGETYAVRASEKIMPALKAIKADYDRRLAEAKAEWQNLDEAYAENTHRNRSEAARRGAETRRRNMIAERAAEVLENAGLNASVASVDESTDSLQIPTQPMNVEF